MSSPATSNETTTEHHDEDSPLAAESGSAVADAMDDPLVAQASALLDIFAAKYRQLEKKAAQPEIPVDVPHFTTEQGPWAF